MEIITYSDAYREQVIKLIFDILEGEFGRHSVKGRPDLHKISEVYQKGKGNFWVAIENGNVVGTIALQDYGGGRGYLARMYVKKELRRMGVGNKLMTALLEFASKNNYKEIFLSTWDGTVSANNFYIKNGFKEIKYLPLEIYHSSSDSVFYKLDI